MLFNWFALGFYYSSGFLARMFYGAQSRIMDGTLARANCLLITTLWSAFKFVMVPLGIELGALFPPETYAVVFILIWGGYTAADAFALCLGAVLSRGLPGPWVGLAVAVAALSTLLELFSPRGTDDFTMATGNALLCWAFGALLF